MNTSNFQVSVGSMHSISLDSKGQIWSWGDNESGQLGTGDTNNRIHPINISKNFGKGIKLLQISAGSYYNIALDNRGRVWTWGSNTFGQLGNGRGNFDELETIPILVSSNFDGSRIVQISAGDRHTLALDEVGNVWSWGWNNSGQLGNGKGDNDELETSPIKVLSDFGGSKIIKISAGGYHSLALDELGRVWAWGNNSYGQLGNGKIGKSEVEKLPINISDNFKSGIKIVDIYAGQNNSFAYNLGQLWGWGDNSNGQLGIGDTQNKSIPTIITGEPDEYDDVKLVKLSSSSTHTIVIDEEGTVYTWGLNQVGQLGNSNTTNSSEPLDITSLFGKNKIVDISAGTSNSIAIDERGQTWVWEYNNVNNNFQNNYTPKKVYYTNLNNIKMNTRNFQVSNSSNHNIALDSKGRVLVWGENESGQLGTGNTDNTIIPIDISKNFSEGTKIVEISAGYSHSLALDDSGEVWSWGSNISGELGNGESGKNKNKNTPIRVSSDFGGSKIIQISAGDSYSIALDDRGRVWAWGTNEYGELGTGDNENKTIPNLISGDFQEITVLRISAGTYHNLAVDDRGRLWAWGDNSHGQLGTGDIENRLIPTNISENFKTDTQIVQVYAGEVTSFALDIRGRILAWGNNDFGQLGTEDGQNKLIPTSITEEPDESDDVKIVKISAGSNHTIVIDEEATVYTWGSNEFGQLGNGNTAESSNPLVITSQFGKNKILDISAGNSDSIAIDSQGQIWTWGYNAVENFGSNSFTPTKLLRSLPVYNYTEKDFINNFVVTKYLPNEITEELVKRKNKNILPNYESFIQQYSSILNKLPKKDKNTVAKFLYSRYTGFYNIGEDEFKYLQNRFQNSKKYLTTEFNNLYKKHDIVVNSNPEKQMNNLVNISNLVSRDFENNTYLTIENIKDKSERNYDETSILNQKITIQAFKILITKLNDKDIKININTDN